MNKFVIIQDRIKCFLKEKVDPVVRIAKLLGNGQTFTTLTKYIPALAYSEGKEKAQEMLFKAIDMSEARDKKQRKRETQRFLERLVAA